MTVSLKLMLRDRVVGVDLLGAIVCSPFLSYPHITTRKKKVIDQKLFVLDTVAEQGAI